MNLRKGILFVTLAVGIAAGIVVVSAGAIFAGYQIVRDGTAVVFALELAAVEYLPAGREARRIGCARELANDLAGDVVGRPLGYALQPYRLCVARARKEGRLELAL
jgi:hypothetical protein